MASSTRESLARRVLIASFLLFACPLLIYFFFVFQSDYKAKLRDTVTRFENIGRSRGIILSDLTKYNFRTLEMLEEFLHFEQANLDLPNEQINAILQEFATTGHFDSISYFTITTDGKFICTLSSDPYKVGKDYTSYHYVQNAVIYDQVSFLAFGSSSQQRRFHVAKTIYSKKTHERIGVLNIATSVNELLKHVLMSDSGDSTPYPIHFSVLTEDKVVFESSHPDFSLRQLVKLSPSQLRKIEATKQFSDTKLKKNNITMTAIDGFDNVVELSQNGITHIAIFLPIPGTDLNLLGSAIKEQVFLPERRNLIIVLSLFVVVFVLGAIATLWMTGKMSKPLATLCNVMKKVSKGDLHAKYVGDSMGFEINAIGNIFNDTIEQLVKNMEAAEQERMQKETLRQELKIGYDIQTSILPRRMPVFPGIEITARYTPAKEVGGDFYDIFVKQDPAGDKLFVTVADAAGKGISACLYSLCVRSMLRSYYLAHDEITTIMQRANHLFCQDTDDTGMFVTVLTTIYDPKTRLLTYSSCGHNPGFVRRTDGSIETLMTPGMAMGVIDYEHVEGKSIQLYQGDLIILYTDGVTEAHNEHGELYEEERLLNFIRETDKESVEEISDKLLDELHSFASKTVQHDDITIIIMRVV